MENRPTICPQMMDNASNDSPLKRMISVIPEVVVKNPSNK